jgi:hypothetical protein
MKREKMNVPEFVKLNKHLKGGGFLYTEHEGGKWKILDLEITTEEIIKQLQNEDYWFNTKQFLEQPGHSKRNMLRTEDKDVFIASIKFPDGRVWDSYFREFRK